MLKLSRLVAIGVCAAAFGLGASAQAATVVADINTLFPGLTPGLTFEVTSTSGSVGSFSLNTDAEGTSNGIGWSAAAADALVGFNYGGYTCTTNCYAPPQLAGASPTGRLHASYGFTITFDSAIKWFLVAFSNDSTQQGGFDFGMAPTYVSQNITVNGTQLAMNNSAGGWALFTGLDTTMISHINWFLNSNGTPDGYHVAWFAGTTPVPLPASAWLLLTGLAGFGALSRRRRTAAEAA